MTTLILARHGETEWNRTGRWQGQADAPLNERGREQARALRQALADEPVVAIYASDLSRARETAEIVAEPHGLPVEVDARLREVDVGGWSGLTTPEIESRYPHTVGLWRSGEPAHAFDGGETYAEMGERVVAALREIAERHAGEQVLVVCHGGPIRALLAHASGITYEEQRERREHLDNCGFVRIAVQDGTFAGLD